VTGATAAPTLESEGILLQRNEYVHVFFEVGGTNPVFSVVIWWYSAISGIWHRGETLNVNANDLTTLEVQGLSRMYLQVSAVSGTTPTLNAWVGLVVPV
jgi:hypothetical protein